MTTLRVRLLPLLLGVALCACGSEDTPAPPPPVQVETAIPIEASPPLRLGKREASQGAEWSASINRRFVDGGQEYLELLLPAETAGQDDRVLITLNDAAPGDLAFWHSIEGRPVLLVRRRQGDPGAPASGQVLRAAGWSSQPGPLAERHVFKAPAAPDAQLDATLKTLWTTAASTHFVGRRHGWFQFAAGRLQEKSGVPAPDLATRGPRTELTQLMETTTGATSIQEALQYDRGLRLDRAPQVRDIPIDTLAAVPLQAHPFAAMQAALAKPDGGTPEPLAAVVPAEFWYARFDDIRVFLRLLDEADAWVTPIVQILQSNPEDRKLAERYQAQLGLRRSGLAKLLGHTVVGPIALTGSDPYLREGSDLTLIFTVKQQSVFDHELAAHLDGYRASVPGIASSSRDYAGVAIQEHRDPTGHVRQQRAQIGELAIVSNSARACERVIDAIQGKTARLSEEADLRYLLARDPGAHQALVFLSDKFIAAVVGAPQKILAARRQQALAELQTPAYAALLHGWLHGVAPVDTEALLASGLLGKDELTHADGQAIAFRVGEAPNSVWGQPQALTPLIDLPPITQVSAAEQTAYQTFVTSYQQYWRQFIDPVAIRADLRELGTSSKVEIDVRILPLISGTDYSDIASVVGDARVSVPVLSRGLQAVWAVAPDASIRNTLDGLMRSSTGQADVGIGWLGGWVALGLDDRASMVELLSRFENRVQLPAPKPPGDEFTDLELWQRIGKFPIYAMAEVKNPVMLVATLTAIRTMLGQVAPGWVEWGEGGKHRELSIVRVGASRTTPMLPNPAMADAVALYYVQTGTAFVLALNPDTLKAVVDRLLDGEGPGTAPGSTAQFVVEGRSRATAPLWTTLLWLIQGQANETQEAARNTAEIVLRGAPDTLADQARFDALSLAYLGAIPLNTRGDTAFVLSPDGVADQSSGSTLVPNYVALPIEGSPVAKLMQRLTGIRGEISFDRETAAGPEARSLHTRFELSLGEQP